MLVTGIKVVLRYYMKNILLPIIMPLLLFSCIDKQEINYDYLDNKLSTDKRVQMLLEQMSLEEKIGQMTMVERKYIRNKDISDFYIGAILSGGGSSPSPNNIESWRVMISNMQR